MNIITLLSVKSVTCKCYKTKKIERAAQEMRQESMESLVTWRGGTSAQPCSAQHSATPLTQPLACLVLIDIREDNFWLRLFYINIKPYPFILITMEILLIQNVLKKMRDRRDWVCIFLFYFPQNYFGSTYLDFKEFFSNIQWSWQKRFLPTPSYSLNPVALPDISSLDRQRFWFKTNYGDWLGNVLGWLQAHLMQY